MKAKCKSLTANGYTNNKITIGKEYEVLERIGKGYIRLINDDLNSVNVIIADHLSKEINPAQYNNLIIDTIRVLDTMGGKITHCSTCIHAIEHKTKIRQELAKQRSDK